MGLEIVATTITTDQQTFRVLQHQIRATGLMKASTIHSRARELMTLIQVRTLTMEMSKMEIRSQELEKKFKEKT